VALARSEGPTALLLSRQKLPLLAETDPEAVGRGGYVLAGDDDPQVILMATGSEVAVALEARDVLAGQGIAARVVSMPSWELFEAQPRKYREQVLPPAVTARLAVEAGVALGWDRYVGAAGATLTHDRFGASAPYKVLAEEFGFTAGAVAERARTLLE
jgi:transketolase